VLHNHVLATPHYRMLYGRDVSDPQLAARVKRHLRAVLRALMGPDAQRTPRPPRRA